MYLLLPQLHGVGSASLRVKARSVNLHRQAHSEQVQSTGNTPCLERGHSLRPAQPHPPGWRQTAYNKGQQGSVANAHGAVPLPGPSPSGLPHTISSEILWFLTSFFFFTWG